MARPDRPSRSALDWLWRFVLTVVLPLAVTCALVAVLADPTRLDVSELRRNSLLMSTRPVFRSTAFADVLWASLGSSALLFVTAIAGAIAVAVPAGIAYAWSTNRPAKAIAWGASTVAASLPAFFWAVALELLIVFAYLRFGLRLLPNAGFGIDEHLVLPALALGARPAAYIFRLVATAVEEIRHTDYVRTAIAKGLGERLLLMRHVLPNAMPEIAAAVVLAARGALSSLIIVEFVYVWGGAALTFVQALGNRRLELTISIALAFAIVSVLLRFAAEVAESRVRARI